MANQPLYVPNGRPSLRATIYSAPPHLAPDPASPQSPHAEHHTSDDDDDNEDGDGENDTEPDLELDSSNHDEVLQDEAAEYDEVADNLNIQEELRRRIAVEGNQNTRLEYEEALEMLETHFRHLSERTTLQTLGDIPDVSLPSEAPKSPTSQRLTYGSNGDVYNPYDPYSSKEYIAQEIAAGRMTRPDGPSAAQRKNGPHSTNEDIHNVNCLANISRRAGETDILLCARLLVQGGEVTEEDLILIPLHRDHADITALADFVDTTQLNAFMNSSYDPSDIQHPLLQYAIHCLDVNSLPTLGPEPAPVSSTMDQTRASLWGGDDPRLYLSAAFLGDSSPAASLNASSSPAMGLETEQPLVPDLFGILSDALSLGRVSSEGSEPESSSPYDQGNRQNIGTRSLRPRRATTLQQAAGAVGGEVPHSSQSSLARTPAQVSLSAKLDRKLDRKRRRTGASPSNTITSPLVLGVSQARSSGRPQLPQAPFRRTNTGTSGLPGGPGRPRMRPSPLVSVPRSSLTPLVTASGEGIFIPQVLERLPEEARSIIYEHLGLSTRTTSTTTNSNQSLLPPLRRALDQHVCFTSELFPRSYDAEKRLAILNILRTKAPYTVLVGVSTLPGQPKIEYYLEPRQSSGHESMDLPLGPNGQGWPANRIPLEIFDRITGYLSRDTIEQLRLVNHELEKKVSDCLFRNVVVPFTPKIYGMLAAEGKPEEVTAVECEDAKGEGKSKAKGKEISGDQDSAVQEVHDGMATFKGWGPRVRTFAMAFDADQEQLSRPPKKSKLKEVTTFWGQYEWPHPFYNRYASIEDLEKKADEYSCMSLALSNLHKTHKLGLSIDSGLGWLEGPDMSDRVRLFKEPPKIFGKTHQHLDAKATERKQDWDSILRTLGLDTATYAVEGNTIRSAQGPIWRNSYGFYEAIVGHRYEKTPNGDMVNKKCITLVDNGPRRSNGFLVFQGANLSASGNASQPPTGTPTFTIRSFGQGNNDSPFKAASLVPSDLTAGQKEWLLETEWAQRAFLSSYCMALMDNSVTFQHVESLVISKLSSRYLPALQRKDFWSALPNLNSLTMKVSADFRDIQKNDSGIVEALDIEPSKAAGHFYNLLNVCVAAVSGIKTLDLGYCGGGERQTGIFGRNQHVLPAPLTNFSNQRGGLATNIIVLPHVEHLALSNCWIAPPTLKGFVKKMAAHKMHTLTLNSVSLSGHSDVMQPNEPNPLGNGVYSTANGPPRHFNYRKLGNLWAQRGKALDPSSDPASWLFTGARIGSWRNVIDTITPGPTVDLLRYAYNYRDDAPAMHDPGALQRINFISCGYIKLVNQPTFDQGFLGDVDITPPASLQRRAMDLMPVMMHRPQDRLLGQIVPVLQIEEVEVFHSCFPMRIGWGNDQSKYDNNEDGQPIGGSGRFSGHVQKLTFKSYE